MLKRTQSTFIMPSGAHRNFTISEVPEVPVGTPAPSHVILSYGTQKKVYGRERLMNLNYEVRVSRLSVPQSPIKACLS